MEITPLLLHHPWLPLTITMAGAMDDPRVSWLDFPSP